MVQKPSIKLGLNQPIHKVYYAQKGKSLGRNISIYIDNFAPIDATKSLAKSIKENCKTSQQAKQKLRLRIEAKYEKALLTIKFQKKGPIFIKRSFSQI